MIFNIFAKDQNVSNPISVEKKSIAHQLAQVSRPVLHEDLVYHILNGLPSEINSFRTSVNTQQLKSLESITSSDLLSLLLSEEHQISDSPSDLTTTSANVAQNTNSSKKSSNSMHYQSNPSFRVFSDWHQTILIMDLTFELVVGVEFFPTLELVVVVLTEVFVEEVLIVAVIVVTMVVDNPISFLLLKHQLSVKYVQDLVILLPTADSDIGFSDHPQAHNTQFDDYSDNFWNSDPEAYVIYADDYSASSAGGEGWTTDSGATHHVTNDLSNLNLHTEYQGTDQVKVGNEAYLPINNIGYSNTQGVTSRKC